MQGYLNVVKSLLYAGFVFLGIETGVVKVLFILMIIDSVFGIVKAFKLKQPFSMKTLMWGMIAKLTMLFIPLVLALMAKALSFDFTYFVVAVMNVLIVNEGISCITNFITIKSGKKVENTDYVTKLLLTIRKGLTAIVQKLLGTIEGKKEEKK